MEAQSVPIHERQFIAGFFDGDGCVRFGSNGQSKAVRSICIKFAQSHATGPPPELAYIHERYRGRMKRKEKGSPKSVRPEWTLSIQSRPDVLRIMEDMLPHTIVKHRELVIAIESLSGRSPRSALDDAVIISDLKKQHSSVEVDPTKICSPYVAGLFAAEGSVGLYETKLPAPRPSYFLVSGFISQPGCPQLLDAIATHFGFGRVSMRRKYMLGGLQMVRFLDRILPFLIGQKTEQARLVVEFQAIKPTHRRTRTPEETETAKEYARKIKKLKKQ